MRDNNRKFPAFSLAFEFIQLGAAHQHKNDRDC